MSGLTAFLQAELLSLSSEARRKHPDIKEAAERLSAILRSFKERPGYSIANELAKSEDVLRPFVLACETKQVKMVTIAIGCIHKLIAVHAIPETSVRTVLKTLTEISVHGVDIQLKILQTVLPLLTNYHAVHDDILAEALLICFRLQDSRIVVVNNTAAATLRQLVIFVFDKVAKEDASEISDDEAKHEIQLNADETLLLHPCAKDAYYLFQDLCLLTNNEQPEYLKLGHLSITFGLELIESVLTNHYSLFRGHKELTLLLHGRVCPLIIKSFSEKHVFPQTMRVTRVVYILIKKFSEILVTECEIFFSTFVKIIEPENPLWLRVLIMEVFRGVCSDASLVSSMYKWYDRQNSSSDVFRDMVTAFGRLATEKPQLVGASHGGRDSIDIVPNVSNHSHYLSMTGGSTVSDTGSAGLSLAYSTMRIQCIDQLDKAESPTIPDTYLFYLSLLCLNAIADGLAGSASSKTATLRAPGKTTTESDQQTSTPEPSTSNDGSNDDPDDLSLVADMANVAWPGLLASMSFYLSANLDEELFQSTMKSYQNFTNVCGILNLVTPRDAFLTNLCKNAIPLTPILTSSFFSGKNSSSTTSLATLSTSAATAVSYQDLPTQQQQLLASITLSDKNLHSLRVLLNICMFLGGVLGSSWYLVLETLQQADFLLFNRPSPKGGANVPGAGSSAPSLRRTLTGNSSSGVSPGTSQTLSPGAQSPSFLPMDADHVAVIKASLDRLFENSRYLDDTAYIGLATSLCRLSAEASGVPFDDGEDGSASKSSRAKLFSNRSFAVEKLRDIALLNMNRLMNPETSSKTWDLIMHHLIANANCPQTLPQIRTQCCDAISEIVLTAMKCVLENDEKMQELQTRLLMTLRRCIHPSPLNDDRGVANENNKTQTIKACSETQHMALGTLNKLLQTSGHSFTCGWRLIFDMLRYVTSTTPSMQLDGIPVEETEPAKEEEARERTSIDTIASSIAPHSHKAASSLIKITFSSLQLICTDFLSHLSSDCLRQCIATLGAFGTQSEDLNISLTAVGLLWNLSDFIRKKQSELASEYPIDDQPIDKESMNIDRAVGEEETPQVLNILWMLLLLQLSHNCTDGRPEVRNGANQTLFRTIKMNGPELGSHLWSTCIWEVLFPLLDSIKMSAIRATKSAASCKPAASSPAASERETSGFMLHHSRDTADKQWDETKVLVLDGFSTIFRDFREKLQALPNFDSAWALLLAHLQDSTLRSSQEVSLASIKSFKNIVTLPEDMVIDETITPYWRAAWTSWEAIGTTMMAKDDTDVAETKALDPDLQRLAVSLSSTYRASLAHDVTQDTLTAFVAMFLYLYRVVAPSFSIDDIGSLLSVLRNVLVYSTSPQYRPDVDHLSPLQEEVLKVICALDTADPGVPPLILMDLSEYMTLAFLSPHDDSQKTKGYVPPNQRKFSTVTYIALNKRCNTMVADMFEKFADNMALYTDGVFERIIGSYGLPMKLKYDCPPSHKHSDDKTPLWKAATKGLVNVLKLGLEKLQQCGKDVPTERFVGVWRTLVDIFEGSLLSPSAPPSDMSTEDLDIDEQFDIEVLDVIGEHIVVYMGEQRIPTEVIDKLVHIIHESSRLYYVDDSDRHRKANEATKQLAVEGEGNRDMAGRHSGIAGTTGTAVPVMKEMLAYHALKSLFILCSSEKQNVPKRVAQATIPVLLERCKTVLENYTADEPLLGRCPFPRYLMGVRKEEMIFILGQSIQLELQQDILTVDGKKGTVKHLLLSGPRAHLFYLYPTLCHMMTCEDKAVVKLIQESFQVAGAEMGLYSASHES